MIKTQIQIPDHLYREAKRISEQYEMSFAEVVRRGLERIVAAYPPRSGARGELRLPKLDLGLKCDPFADPEWRSELWLEAVEVREPLPTTRAKPRRRAR
jgi:hypothetical protein